MIKYIDIDSVKPAEYNPRIIDELQFEKLKKSLIEIGVVIPILVNEKNNIIIAGHQRTRAAREVGLKQIPVILIKGLVEGDEIKFNQIHNAVDKNNTVEIEMDSEYEKEKFIQIDVKEININADKKTFVKEVCKIILKYGNVLSCVICKNIIIAGEYYIAACKLLNLKANAYICNDEKFDTLIDKFGADYGKFSYDQLKKNTFVQGLAQLHRNVKKKEGLIKQNKSTLYVQYVIPYLDNDYKKSILDFGCGKGAYITMLQERYDAIGLEFFNNNGSKINVSKGNRQIDELIKHIKTEQRQFDVVVCDSVLNSIDSLKAEQSIMQCLNLFCKSKLFISGRPIDLAKNTERLKRDTCVNKRFIEFYDKDGFTANYRKGNWYYQKYHSKEQIIHLLEKYGFKAIKISWNKFGGSFQVEADKIMSLNKQDHIDGLTFEFNLPLPGNKSYNRHNDIINAIDWNKYGCN